MSEIEPIPQAREYQRELFELCKSQNVVVSIPTGSGKTLVAWMLIEHLLMQQLQNNQLDEKKIIFVCPTQALVIQQAQVLQSWLKASTAEQLRQLNVGRVFGMSYERLWHSQPNVSIIVMTPQILLDELKLSEGRLLSRFALIVLDEAHHTTKNHPMNKIMHNFFVPRILRNETAGLPQVVGLTASPAAEPTTGATLLQLAALSRNLGCAIRSVQENVDNLMQHVHQPKLEILPTEMDDVSRGFHDRMSACFCTLVSCVDDILLNEGDIAFLDSHLRAISALNDAMLENDTVSARSAWRRLKDIIAQNPGPFQLCGLSTLSYDGVPLPTITKKDEKLLEHLRELDLSKHKILVFVRSREGAHKLQDYLEAELDNAEDKVGLLIGQEEMTEKQQKEAIKRFDEGTTRILVATSVAEEGIDIPECTIVARLFALDSALQLVQCRGRARHATATFLFFFHTAFVKHERKARHVATHEQKMRRAIEAMTHGETSANTLIYKTRAEEGIASILPQIWQKLGEHAEGQPDHEAVNMQALNELLYARDPIQMLLNTVKKLTGKDPIYTVQAVAVWPSTAFRCTISIDALPGVTWTSDVKSNKQDTKKDAAQKALLDFVKRDLQVTYRKQQ